MIVGWIDHIALIINFLKNGTLVDTGILNASIMTRYSLVVNKRGTILSFKVVDADPELFPVRDMTGHHFSRLIGEDLRSPFPIFLMSR